ncbi:MAG: PQQ-binding-like beta-propeller repeat protein, partial [Gimesia sp.]
MHSIILTRTILFIVTIGLILPASVSLLADEKKEKPDDFQPNAPKQVPKQPPLNQLKQIIQGIFGQPNAAPAKRANSKDPDHYRFPQDLEQERRFKSVQKLIKDQQWEAARLKLQLMLENSINLPVHVSGERSLITDRELIYRQLKLLPVEQRVKFNRQYAALAEKRFHDAQLDESPPEIYAEIATRFAGTPFGLKAMNYLTSYHMERGEFGLADQYLQRLLIHEAPITKSQQWRTKAAFIFKQTGKQSLIEDLFQSENQSSKPDQQIKIAGSDEIPQNWLNKQRLLNTNSNPLQDEWPMLFGSPSRLARAKNADPLLIPRWSFPLTSNHTLQAQLNLIQEDLTYAQHATVPALPPIAINGKIVFRTLRGVQVLDSQTGTPLWESPLKNSPESSYISAQLKRLRTPQARGLFDSDPNTQSFAPYTGTDPDSHPLTSLLYRNANWGSQSSDGQRLFILESMHLNFGSSRYIRNFNRFGRGGNTFGASNRSANQIVAYDLESGQPRWKIGGIRFDEPFDLPLAGTFFFGAPTPAGDELYIVGERDREIRVYALDPQTGEERWSQQIGNPDQDITFDTVRRWWIAPVAVDQGVLVCPTTIG